MVLLLDGCSISDALVCVVKCVDWAPQGVCIYRQQSSARPHMRYHLIEVPWSQQIYSLYKNSFLQFQNSASVSLNCFVCQYVWSFVLPFVFYLPLFRSQLFFLRAYKHGHTIFCNTFNCVIMLWIVHHAME